MRKILLYFILLITSSCAIQVPPGGGEKDSSPPELVGSEPDTFATGFSGTSIRLDFNEYIQVRDAATQLIVSPPLKQQPVVKARKKSIIVSFDEDTLSPQTTYTMNFGTALSDVNEGNVKQDFQFVFSTGDKLDSLAVSGTVLNSKDLKPEEGCTVMLYKGDDDSLPFNHRPDYFTRTSKEGIFRIRNIASGDYKIIAIKDLDGDYKYSPSVESIAWLPDRIKAGDENVKMMLFTEAPKSAIVKAFSEYPGKANVVFNSAVEMKNIEWLMDTTAVLVYKKRWSNTGDTLSVFYENTNYDSLKLRIKQFPEDTIIIRLLRLQGKQGGKGEKFMITGDRSSENPYFMPFYVNANRPIKTLDRSKIILLEDTIVVDHTSTIEDSLNGRIRFDYQWKQKKKYKLFFLPEAVQSLYYDKNDSIQFTFTTDSENDYGNMTLRMKFPKPGSYTVQLVGNDDKMYYEQYRQGAEAVVSFNKLVPRQYRLKLIDDQNGNMKWDTGSYIDKKQPESISYYSEQITVRANWDVEVDWSK